MKSQPAITKIRPVIMKTWTIHNKVMICHHKNLDTVQNKINKILTCHHANLDRS